MRIINALGVQLCWTKLNVLFKIKIHMTYLNEILYKTLYLSY